MSTERERRIPNGMKPATRGDQNPLDTIEKALRETIFGQSRAIDSLVRALNRARLGFNAGHSNRPRATLLFLGPTGVGKSESAKRLAELLHPEGGGFLKIDCSLFSQGHEVSALLGAPPSYVGRDQKPLFDPDIIEVDNSVILFDEIEKGTTELWNLLLQIMEDGEITLLNGGRRVSFSKSIVIMTTNVGAKEMADFVDRRTIGFRTSQKDVEGTGQQIYQIGFEALQRVFRPEWINRIDEVIAFRPLSSQTLSYILDRMIKEANEQYMRHGIQVELTEDARDYLLRRGFDPRFGARPLRARLLKDLDAPLADLLASGGIPEGCRVLVDLSEEEGSHGENLSFYYQPDEELAAVARRHKSVQVAQEQKPQPDQPQHTPGPAVARSAEGSRR
ncbi:MAG: ATPase [Herpetosiphonaceae bacterium]|nr:MAG: ATPase [Herpetosiphonaceae bacterium]